MSRAQLRDASNSQKFFFRKNVFREGSSRSSSVASSCCSSAVNGDAPRKEKKLRNCFPTVPAPENGVQKEPVEQEYAEMTMNEIMNGDVCTPCDSDVDMANSRLGRDVYWTSWAGLRVRGHVGC